MNTKNRSTSKRRSKSGGRALSLPKQSNFYSSMGPNGHHEMILPQPAPRAALVLFCLHDSALSPSVKSVESVVKVLWLQFFRPALLCSLRALCVKYCSRIKSPVAAACAASSSGPAPNSHQSRINRTHPNPSEPSLFVLCPRPLVRGPAARL